jgi:adenine-specific DNA-methyltransferase
MFGLTLLATWNIYRTTMTPPPLTLSNHAAGVHAAAPIARRDFEPETLAEVSARARAWAETIDDKKRQQAAWSFMKASIDFYVSLRNQQLDYILSIEPPEIALPYPLDSSARELARRLALGASKFPIADACHHLSSVYTGLVPSKLRSATGMFYTPPALADHLLQMASEAGVDWLAARVLDPACGGGAFLLPVALKIRQSMADCPAGEILNSISTRLKGFEVDPFAGWMTQTWLEIALGDLVATTGVRLPKLVEICDSLEREPDGGLFDLVVGNPPFGRVSLEPRQRARFSRSLFGHANLYGLFTDAALRWAKPDGIVAFVTPTSFLAGEYFKNLRATLADEAPPLRIDFVGGRKGVFEDVLQETLLSTYGRGKKADTAEVRTLDINSLGAVAASEVGSLTLPHIRRDPWLLPRNAEQNKLVERLVTMPSRLRDWGYQVSTGPLVWNRHKEQLRNTLGINTLPLIWAESVGSFGFEHRALKRNHKPYFEAGGPADEWLKMSAPCVLVQRTTAKEQARRLIAGELPAPFIRKFGAVVVENHLNMILPIKGQTPMVSVSALAAFLNSEVADLAFRCISGSVAVSAYELEALPLPSPSKAREFEELLRLGHAPRAVEAHLRSLYFGNEAE